MVWAVIAAAPSKLTCLPPKHYEVNDLEAAVRGCLSYLSLYQAHLVDGKLWDVTLRVHTDGAYHGGMLLDDMGRDDAALPVLSCVCVMLLGNEGDGTAEQKACAEKILDDIILGTRIIRFSNIASTFTFTSPNQAARASP